ncbi:ammonium transporter [Blastopirellula sp. JC732]|uniref:Ammonium transporter n=1 Tax=Blastopirellula sediminis TaxID=2894196 RepID=A0A9X1SM22_9BACT|nr:ammonium transporter [Blastopirellula sediminis]MCC9605441.1 ammonium transporter [Blastopirellula sediminis]MCC9631259.1 ammonium transporter [Blastopirellula sediminis]
MLSSLSLNPKLWCMFCALAVAMVVAAPLRAQDANATEAPAAEAAAEGEMAPEAEAEEEEAPPTIESLSADLAAFQGDVDTLWTCLAAFLVFFMQAGFALVECGFTRAKNACNIIMKNLMDFSVGSLVFWLVGFGLMFGVTNGFCGTTLFVFDGASEAALETNSNEGFNWAFLIFQTVFAATAATIVSGAMAERTKFVAYLCYSFLITLIVYPIFGSWAWGGLYAGGGWLEGQGFLDFAGSTVVHSVGGWAALAGAIVIGPRIGKYTADGKIKPIPGHNIPLAALGVFILWLGWFGFNPGSTTAVGGGSFAYIAVTTNLSAAAGAIGALMVSWIMFKKPDTSFALNGALAGLVGITAGCDIMSPVYASITGLIAGMIVVFSCVFFDKIKIDDPVGAVSVHGVCGAWGTLAIGLWAGDVGILTGGGPAQLITQAIGVASAFGWAFGTSLIIFLLLKFTIGLRVPAEEEIKGLDITEHGMYAYPPHLVSESLGGTPGGSPATASSTSGAVTHGA